MRLVLLAFLSGMMALWQGTPLYLGLYAIYVGITAFAIMTLQQAPDRAGRPHFIFYSLIVTLPLFWVLGICIILWSFEAPFVQMLAMALLFACLLNLLTVRAVEPVLINWDVFAMAAALIGMVVIDLQRFGMSGRVLVLAAVSVTIMVYFLNCAMAIVRFRKALDSAREIELKRSKVEALGRITGGVAHDFNNLLTVILGNVELARLGKNPQETDQLLEEVQSAGERAARLTAQLLSFSRQAVLQPRDVRIGTLIDEARGLLARVLPDTVVVTYILPAHPLPPVILDPGKFEAVLLNLAMNSRDAMPEGGNLMIEAGLDMLTLPQSRVLGRRPGQYLVVTVTDEGTGIPQEDLSRVTDPFYTTKAVGEGSGLGLSMAKGFAEQTGGGLAIESVIGEGTSVRLFIPLDRRGLDAISY